MTFHPGWVTRSVTSHDIWGGNDDGAGDQNPREGDYHVLFHAKGEGRILRLWMTDVRESFPEKYKELWIVTDGQTVTAVIRLIFSPDAPSGRRPSCWVTTRVRGFFQLRAISI